MFCEEKKSKCPKKNFQSVKRGEEYLSMEFRVFEKKMKWERNVRVVCYPVSWAPCWLKIQSHGLIWKDKVKIAVAEKKEMKSGIFIYWVRTHWLGAMLWMNQKLGAMLWMNLGNLKSDFVRYIHLRLYSGPFGCRVPS